MKTFYLKNSIVLLATLFVAGITSACSNNDDFDDDITAVNTLRIQSENYSGTGLVYQSISNQEKELMHKKGSTHMIYHLLFGCNIKESPVFSMLSIDIQEDTERGFNELQIGETFDSSEIRVVAYYTPQEKKVDVDHLMILKGTTALSGQVTLVDKKEHVITLRLNNLTFDAIDKTCIYTINGTIEFEV